MTLDELKPLLKIGKIGMIPRWKGYIKYDHGLDLIYFVNNDYKMYQSELEDNIKNRTDLFYII